MNIEQDIDKVMRVIKSCSTFEQLLSANNLVTIAARRYPEKEVELFFNEHLKYQFNKIVYGYRDTNIN
tara:strand:- start:22062 stop:22265 length:204 start_codon:yes stop_codon:yes gene_type:complete